MWHFPNWNPVAFHIGSWPVYWYGLMYLTGFLMAWALLSLRRQTHAPFLLKDQVGDIIFFSALGVMIGGRLGYLLFYDTAVFFHDPILLFKPWKGGMSFHGGLIGVLLAIWFYAHKVHQSFWTLTDYIAPVVPLGLAAGRFGNFINGELWGRVTQVSWGMIFPQAGNELRHPSQLYEFCLEGILLFIFLWIYSRKKRPLAAVSAFFLIGYALCRMFVEFFREPDPQIGFIAWGWLTEGQLLCAPMLLLGLFILGFAYFRAGR